MASTIWTDVLIRCMRAFVQPVCITTEDRDNENNHDKDKVQEIGVGYLDRLVDVMNESFSSAGMRYHGGSW